MAAAPAAASGSQVGRSVWDAACLPMLGSASPRSRPGSVGAEDPSSQGKHRTIPNARCVIHPRLPFPCSQGFSAETRPGQQTFRASYRLQWLQLYPALPAKMQIGHQPDQLVCRRRFLSRLDDLLTTASVRRPVWWAWHAQMRTNSNAQVERPFLFFWIRT